MNRLAPLVALFVVLSSLPAWAEERPLVVDVWPGKAPGDIGISGEEKTFEAPPRKTEPDKPYRVAGRPCMLITNVSRVTLSIYRPAKEKDTGASMIICPGGGYYNLFWDLHGVEPAEWLNSIGITGIVLKYRVPRRPGEEIPLPASGPIKDAQRAVSLVRSRAKEWGLDPARIGMLGFSAGGHLAAATAMNFDRRSYEAIDDIDQVSCRPDFAVLVYPGYLTRTKDQLSPDVRPSKETPPTMFIVASDDQHLSADDCALTYVALRRAGALTELHAYTTGGHPFGVRKSDEICTTWPQRCEEWLRARQVIKSNTTR
jgi:acetyl esterase/lipase